MLITVQCAACHKRYKVDSKLGGKTLKCKNCGGAVVIPQTPPSEAPAGDDLMAGLAAASAAEHAAPPSRSRQPPAPPGVASPASVRQPSQRRPAAAALPSTTPAAVASLNEEVSGDTPCPACGASIPAANRVCLNCGFNRATGKRVATAAVRARSGADDEARDARGYRRTAEYATPFLRSLDTIIAQVGMWVFWLLVAYLIFISIAQTIEIARLAEQRHASVPGFVYFASLLSLPIALLLWTLVQVPLSTLAVRLAGMMLKFELPEDARWRVLLSQSVALLYALIGAAVVTLRVWSHDVADRGFLYAAVGGLAATPFIALITVPISVPTHFFVSWLLLRLRGIEALVAWVLQFIAMMVFGGIMAVVALVLFIILR